MANKSENEIQRKSRFKRFICWVRINIFGISYVALIIGLWTYIIINWDKCISMKFFEQFDGNNILFLVGIAMVITFFYDVEAKDFKFHRRKNENMVRQFQNAENRFNNIQADFPPVQIMNVENNGGNSDEQTGRSNSN